MNLKILFYWKYTLIQRVNDYRLLTAEGWLELKEENYKRKFFELSKNFYSNIFSTLEANSWTLAELSTKLSLMKPFAALFIGEDSDFRWIFNLESFWIPSHVGQVEHSAEERVREEREEILSSFPRLPRCLLMLKWETNPTIHVLALYMTFEFFFFWIDTKRRL